MKINMNWFMGVLFIGVVLLFGWFSNPKGLTHSMKLILILTVIFVLTYLVFFVINRVFNCKDNIGPGVAAVILISPLAEIYDKHSVSTDNMIWLGIAIAIYIGVLLFIQKEDLKKQREKNAVMECISQRFGALEVKIEDSTYPIHNCSKVTTPTGESTYFYYDKKTNTVREV